MGHGLLVVCLSVIALVGSAWGAESGFVPAGSFTIAALNGEPVAAKDDAQVPTMEFLATDQRVAGTSGINRYAGGFTWQGEQLTFGQLLSTMMAGSEPAMQREQAFLKVLSVPLTVTKVDQGFQLAGTMGKLVLVKSEAPVNPR